MINIALVEDNYYALLALKEKLAHYDDIHICYEASNGKDIISWLSQHPQIDELDAIMMDINMPIQNGIESTLLIKAIYPKVKIIIITIYDNDDYIFNAIKSGADSYILKDTKAEKIYETILDTLAGGSVMSPSIAMKTLNMLKNASNNTSSTAQIEKYALSERETQILQQISKGFSNKIIAQNLIISPFTVKRHIENIYQKLHAHNRVELLVKARNEGLI
jgi:DNA-binding NarL/FixJ family response regulator